MSAAAQSWHGHGVSPRPGVPAVLVHQSPTWKESSRPPGLAAPVARRVALAGARGSVRYHHAGTAFCNTTPLVRYWHTFCRTTYQPVCDDFLQNV